MKYICLWSWSVVLVSCHVVYAMDGNVPMSKEKSAYIQRILSLGSLSPVSARAVTLWTGKKVMLNTVTKTMRKLHSLYNENPYALYNLKIYAHKTDSADEIPLYLLDICILYDLCNKFTQKLCDDVRAIICAGVNRHMRYPIVWLVNPVVNPIAD